MGCINKQDLRLIPISDGEYVLGKDLIYSIGKMKIVVPEGFRTDLASIPKALWCILPPYGKYNFAAILHDFLYSKYNTTGINKVIADNIFYQLMLDDGVSDITAKMMYRAVYALGEPCFKTPKIDGSTPYKDKALIDHTTEAKNYYSKMEELLGKRFVGR